MVELEYFETHLTNHCNLNCRGCTHFSPLADPWFKDIEEFDYEMERLHDIMTVKKIHLMGGEPLLHPELIKFCRSTRSFFPDSQIEIVTNGILLDKIANLAEELNELKIYINVSNYYLIENLEKKLEPFEYRAIENRELMYNPGIDLSASKNAEQEYQRCDARFYKCFYFQNGFFYICPLIANINIFEKYFNKDLGIDPNENRIDIYTSTGEEIYEFLHKASPACKMCDIPFRISHYKTYKQSNKDIYEWINEEKNPYALI